MIGRILGRGSVPLSRLVDLRALTLRARGYQLVNAALVPIVGERLRVTHVVEFPKCGGSWVRNCVLTYLGLEPNVNSHIVRRNDVLHGHRLYRSFYNWPIIVVRDPRDTYVSLFHHETSLNRVRNVQSDFDRYFVRDPDRDVREDFADYLDARFSRRFHPWFTYAEFTRSWLDRQGILLVRYEDMLKDAEHQIVRILEFIGHPVDRERVRESVAENSFARQTRRLYGEARDPGQGDATKFLRKGVSGDWRNHFNARACERFWETEGEALRRLGYESDAGWIPAFLQGIDEATASATDRQPVP